MMLKHPRTMIGAALFCAALLLPVAALLFPANSSNRVVYISHTVSTEIKAIDTWRNGDIAVNTASEEELEKLPGIGPSLAQNIIAERDLHGAYHYPEDLTAAKGIGNSKLQKIIDYIDLSTVQPERN